MIVMLCELYGVTRGDECETPVCKWLSPGAQYPSQGLWNDVIP